GLTAAQSNPYLRFLLRLLPPAPFAIFFLVALFLLFAGLGQVLGRALATLQCSNCQRVVCRRCVFRMQQRAFCDGCYAAVKDLKSVEFTRILLTGRGSRAARRRTVLETLTTFLLPGASLSGFVAILIMVGAAILVAANGLIVPSPDILPVASSGWGKRIPLAILFGLTYAITVARYYAKTTDKVQSITHSDGRAGGRAASSGAKTRERRA